LSLRVSTTCCNSSIQLESQLYM